MGRMGGAAAPDLATADAVVAAAPHAGAVQPLHLEDRVVPHHPLSLGEVVHLIPAAQPRRRSISGGLAMLWHGPAGFSHCSALRNEMFTKVGTLSENLA